MSKKQGLNSRRVGILGKIILIFLQTVNMRKLIPVLLVCLVISPVLISQTNTLHFPHNSRVCFVGNSITMNGEFVHYVRSFYATRFPDRNIHFFNCGISGDVTGGILARMEPDIMAKRPDYAVIMIGMNDIGRPMYSAKRSNEDSIAWKKQQALVTYKANLEKIIQYFLSKKVKVILQKPSIYDQTAKVTSENMFGANDALKSCADYMQEFADRYQLKVVDYWTLMTVINQQMQQKDPAFTIVGNDRVHPASPGHFVMAWQFLHTTLGDLPVAEIRVNVTKKTATAKNATVKDLVTSKNAVRFNYIPKAIPFSVNIAAAPALALVPFTNALNTELLVVSGLVTGDYTIYMNDTLAGSATADQLAKGINLAELNTPQLRQAKAVVDYGLQYRSVENDLRALRHVEYRQLAKYPYREQSDSVIAYVTRQLKDTAVKGPDRTRLEKYLTNKKNEPGINAQLDEMQQELYLINRPPVLKVRIELVK